MNEPEPRHEAFGLLPGHGYSACALRAHFASGALSVDTFTGGLLERIKRYEPAVQAWEWIDETRVLTAARDGARRFAGGDARPLEGIAFGIKDVIETDGIPTRMGSPLFADYVPTASASVVHDLESAGAIILGKTVTTEFATQCPGKTRNPWNPAHTPGGSSSGSAAAVAAGFVPVAIGTQTRGSTIRPAAFCGVVGYKPTFGAVSTAGIFPTSATLDHVGFFANSVEDISLMASVCAPSVKVQAQADGVPPTLAFAASPYWHLAEPPQRRCIEAAIQRFTEAGAPVRSIDLPSDFERALDVTNTIQRFELYHLHGHKLEGWRSSISRQFLEYMESGQRITEQQYRDALDYRGKLIALYDEIVAPYSAVLTAPANGEAPAGITATGDATFCTTWTLCGAPAIAIPAGFGPRHLPLGIQLVGHRHRDGELLDAAHWCEKALKQRPRFA